MVIALKKLNLACGNIVLTGWDNLDYECRANGVIACNLTEKLPYGDNSVDEIFTSHFLEHLKLRTEAIPFLQECERVLKPGGVLSIIVPDFEMLTITKVFDYHHNKFRTPEEQLRWLVGAVFGEGRAKWDYHASGWFEERFREMDSGKISIDPSAGGSIPIWEKMDLTKIIKKWREHSPYEITAIFNKQKGENGKKYEPTWINEEPIVGKGFISPLEYTLNRLPIMANNTPNGDMDGIIRQVDSACNSLSDISDVLPVVKSGNLSENGSTERYTVVYDKGRMLESIWVAHYLIYQKFIHLADKSVTIDLCSESGAGTKLISEYTGRLAIGVDYSDDALRFATKNNSSPHTEYHRLDLNLYDDIRTLKEMIRQGGVKQMFFVEGIEHLKFPYEIVLSALDAGVERIFISTPIVHDHEVNDEHYHITPFTDAYLADFISRFDARIVSYCKHMRLDNIQRELAAGHQLGFFMENYFTGTRPESGNYLISITQ
ncbi:methyltransferase domain-containing protein [Geobacter sp. FeAm09]|uniref:class I SAM-dependent methyltransferase n=1 Tax=Geobacter sp. FeAm09 TaxID=2597769 RepID=UPI0011ED51C4|nr:methyltransferase domain-containing protein [Geobacter sp. FeAm09]QEM69763.1 methyltransferase domain-containing protein [Geobacter sp. FeAm09]